MVWVGNMIKLHFYHVTRIKYEKKQRINPENPAYYVFDVIRTRNAIFKMSISEGQDKSAMNKKEHHISTHVNEEV